MKLKVKIKFPLEGLKRYEAGKVIKKALNDAGGKITKFGTTYVRNDFGVAEMPVKLMLAMAWNDQEYNCFDWKLIDLGGTFTFNFKK